MENLDIKLKSTLNNEKGIALLTVLIAVMIITLLLFEFQYSAMVERKLSYNGLNRLQAYYLAKGSARIGMLRVALYGRLLKDPNIKKIAGSLDITPFLAYVWNTPLPPFPPDPSTISKLIKKDRDAAESFLKQTNIKNGKGSHSIRTEASKINLNFLIVPKALRNEPIDLRSDPDTLFEYIAIALLNLIQGFFDESDDPFEEYGTGRAEEVVYNIMDWVNPGSNSFAGGSKDSFYERQDPPYLAKRNRFYTLGELRLVKGINAALFRKLRPHVTVFSYDGKININEATDKILTALFPDFTEDDLKRLSEEKTRIGGWTSEKQFVAYISETLGRSGFEQIYKDEKIYPFTIGSQSFIVESLGVVTKSASSIQRAIKVALTLTGNNSGSGTGTDFSKIKDEGKCNQTTGAFWDKRFPSSPVCSAKAYSQEQCVNNLTGTWSQRNGQDCCKVNQTGFICVTKAEKDAGGQANNLKLLYWSEI